MDGKHPKNIDSRPKRRRDKDNPYELFTTGLGTDQPRYYLAFVDSSGTEQCMEIDKALFDVFDRFELEDISFMNEVDRHYEQSEQTEQSLNRRAAQPQESVEEAVSSGQRLKHFVRLLPNCLKNSAAGSYCTTLVTLHTSRLQRWRGASIRPYRTPFMLP